MARQNPLLDREIQICRRVREIRTLLEFSRLAFAHKAGSDSSVIIRIELCRMPVRYEVARRICEQFDINQRWLAEGKEPRSPYIPIGPEHERFVPPRMLFSEAYTQMFAREIEAKTEYVVEMAKLGLEARWLLQGEKFQTPSPRMDVLLTIKPTPGTLPQLKVHVEMLRAHARDLLKKARAIEKCIKMAEGHHRA